MSVFNKQIIKLHTKMHNTDIRQINYTILIPK
jgi:hypothetical protein